MPNSLQGSILKETSSAAIDCGFQALAVAAGVPAIMLAVPFAKGLVLGVIENCYNDCAQRILSVREAQKLRQVSEIALKTFRMLSERDCVDAWRMDIDPKYVDYAYEVAEHVTLEAIKQSEQKKVDILGRYYGRQFYMGATDWQDMHQMITMVGALTFRQLVMIRLLSEGFKGYDGNLYISNPSACVEINNLRAYGIWQTEGALWGINESVDIQLKSLIPTLFSKKVCDLLMLDQLTNDDIQRTIDSLCLTSQGRAQEMLSKQEFENRFSNLVYADPLGEIEVDKDATKHLFDNYRGW